MKNLLSEFRTFAMRGNVLDLAIAVVIGAAFGKIVSSLVDTIIMPITGLFTGGIDLSDFALTIDDTAIAYGAFLQSVVDFVIIAFVIFLIVKAVNRFKKKEDAAGAKSGPSEVALLTEIRDLLRGRGM